MIAAEPKAPAERRQQLLPIGQLVFASCTSEEQLEVMEAAFEQRERLPVGTARAAVGLLKAIAKEARTCSCPLAATARRNICYAQLSAECAQVALGAFDPATFRRAHSAAGWGVRSCGTLRLVGEAKARAPVRSLTGHQAREASPCCSWEEQLACHYKINPQVGSFAIAGDTGHGLKTTPSVDAYIC